MAEVVAFYAFGGLAVIFSLLMITRRNPVSSAWSLVVVMVSLAALFVALSATFVAAMQVIVYAGAVMVLFLFVVMLLNLSESELGSPKVTGMKIFGGLIAFGLMVEFLIMAFIPEEAGGAVAGNFGQVAPVARELFSTYLLPFEIASVLLLAAIVGAMVLAGRNEEK